MRYYEIVINWVEIDTKKPYSETISVYARHERAAREKAWQYCKRMEEDTLDATMHRTRIYSVGDIEDKTLS